MSSRSSSSGESETLPVGRVKGHRGLRGEITVTVPAGDPQLWVDVDEVRIVPTTGAARQIAVEKARAYRDRLVLKLAGIDDANVAATLRGARVEVTRDEAPELEPHEYYKAELVGMSVVTEQGTAVGTVEDVIPTGGADLLLVRGPAREGHSGDEVLIPLNRELVPEIGVENRTIVVRPPEGLLELNRRETTS